MHKTHVITKIVIMFIIKLVMAVDNYINDIFLFGLNIVKNRHNYLSGYKHFEL